MKSVYCGVRKLLYAAEFLDVIPMLFADRLCLAEAKLVKRGLAPDLHEHWFAGVASHLLVGRPAEVGCGVLLWVEHIKARRAWWEP